MRTNAAIVESKNGQFSIEELELNDPGPGEVRIKMQACGICRSDLSALAGIERVQFPAVLGHEGTGLVEAIGVGVKRLREGDQVILSWTPACGLCPPCIRGEVQLCQQLSMTEGGLGPLSRNGDAVDRFMKLGAFSETVMVPEAMAIPVECQLDATHSCLIGCGITTGFGAAANTAAVRWGETVAVFGCGGVGLAAIQGARIAGASRIFAIDPLPERLTAAKTVGATDILSPDDVVKKVIAETNGGVDVAIECVGKPGTMADSFFMLRAGGRSIVVGLAGLTEMFQIPAIALLQEKSIKGSIFGSANPAVEFQKLANLGDKGQLDFDTMVGKVRPFSEINEGFTDMREGKYTRVVLEFDNSAR
jgi:S-(hydroxymethyl)glutathione dehydrogenase/alcohol dehydrogenase